MSLRICIAGGGGFIGHWLARRLKKEGHYVVVADVRRGMLLDSDCDEFHQLDLRIFENCLLVTKNVDWVFNLAADMGGMGYIQSNQSLILYNNSLMSFHMIEAARRNGVKRFFYSSTACIYPEHIQESPDVTALAEDMAWPAKPQELYGLEKLVTEELLMHYAKDFGIETRIARFHNIYGPECSWRGGREKAPAAFCRKVASADKEVEMWGDGKQTRSFCYIDDCVEGILRIMRSDYTKPLNLGSDYLISMNDFMTLTSKIGGKALTIKHIPGPEGVRGRNSDNTLIKKVLGWAPSTTLEAGMKVTYDWIKHDMDTGGSGTEDFTKSIVVEKSGDFDRWIKTNADKDTHKLRNL
jgi:GDP-D-mannose 3',5'-epimerase